MKCAQVLSFVFFMTVLWLPEAEAQSVFVRETNGTQTAYPISSIKRLTFSGNSLNVNLFTGNSKSFPLTNIRYVNFKDLFSGAELVKKKETENLTLYPNPVSDILHFCYTMTPEKPVRIRIIASDGKVFLNKMIGKQSPSFDNSMDVSSLPEGLYLFICDEGISIQTNRFLKIK